MRHLLRRVAGLVRRYRVDRRLPPVVVDTFKSGTELRLADLRRRQLARRRGTLGASPASAESPIRRLGDRRVITAGVTNTSAYEAALDTASHVTTVLTEVGVRTFLTRRTGGRLSFGVHLEDRQRALERLAQTAHPGWYLDWHDRSSSGTTSLGDAADSRRAGIARRWTIYRSTNWGDLATGPERGVDVEFFEIGTSRLYEQVGVRGNPRFDARCAETTETISGRDFPGNAAFPVAAGLEYFDQPVHVVYTWVDGGDPAWSAAFRAAADRTGREIDEEALDPARFRSRDELRYSLRSLWAHCGWVERVWLVTAGQRPDWLVEDDVLKVVDHADILPDEVLPTFNSHAIESAIHRIDGLAEHFVYFNDDVFVARPLAPESFFTSNGLVKVFQSEAIAPGFQDENTMAVDTAAQRGRELLRKRFGRVVAGKPFHTAFPSRRSVFTDIEDDFPEVIAQTRASRFRSPTDLSVAASFAQHYAIATGRGVMAEINNRYVNVESDRLGIGLDRIRLADDVDTYCINETKDAGVDDISRETLLSDFFEASLPVPSPWERT